MDLFGRTPFGFRFMQVLFGIAMLPLLYFFGKALFKSPLWSGIATLLLAFDFLHYKMCIRDSAPTIKMTAEMVTMALMK